MTDLRNRFASMLGDEPGVPDDLDGIVAAGRRMLRRRTTITGAAGTVGVAALTAAVVVPITMVGGTARHPNGVSVQSAPTPTPTKPCYVIELKGTGGHRAYMIKKGTGRLPISRLYKDMWKHGNLHIVHYGVGPAKHACTVIPRTGTPAPSSTPTTPPAPGYHYSEPPTRIADRLGTHLRDRLQGWGFSIIYSRPFAQETSRLEKGHPKYFDGNDDVSIGGKPADVGVQVTHAVTTQVPFTGHCAAPKCMQTALPDGSVEQTAHQRSGTGGAMVISVEVHRPNGLVVEAQQANYGFGPEATTARTQQPLTLAQLRTLAEDAAFSF
jgi:hypothetical protein